MWLKKAITLLLFVFFTIGGIPFAGQKPDDKTTLKEVRQEVKEAVEAMENYTVDQRDEALKKVRVAVDDLDTRIEDLENQVDRKWDRMDQAAREKARATLKLLRKKRNELSEWYGGLQQCSVNAWGHVKKGFLDSYKALSEVYDKAAKQF